MIIVFTPVCSAYMHAVAIVVAMLCVCTHFASTIMLAQVAAILTHAL